MREKRMRKGFKMKKMISVLLAAALALSFTACGGSDAGSSAGTAASGGSAAGAGSASQAGASSAAGYSTTLADIQAKGELVIGLDDTFAPMGFRDENNELVGFDIDLATAGCEELGLSLIHI